VRKGKQGNEPQRHARLRQTPARQAGTEERAIGVRIERQQHPTSNIQLKTCRCCFLIALGCETFALWLNDAAL
jgi:hypothetical protein